MPRNCADADFIKNQFFLKNYLVFGINIAYITLRDFLKFNIYGMVSGE